MSKDATPLAVVIVERTGGTRTLTIKDFNKDDNMFYKKCGFKSPTGFDIQTTWVVKIDKCTRYITLRAKTSDGS